MQTLRPLPDDPGWARTGEQLLWLMGSGHEVIQPESGYYYDCRKRFDRHIGLQLTLRGEGYYERAGRITPLRPGMAFFDHLPGDFRYGIPLGATVPYEHVWLDIRGEMAHQLWQQVMRSSGGPVLDLGEDNPVAPMMIALAHEHAFQMPQDRYQLSARLYELIMLICSLLGRSRLTTSSLVQGALRRIHQRGLTPSCHVGTIAQALGCSREHLTRVFAKATGVSPVQYLIQHRLRRAQEELRTTLDPLEVIARRCGFSGANYLCRAFRSQIGITPTAYRTKPWVIRTADS